jgi:hypothetical protein
MKYNEAAFIGQQRAKEAQMKLFEYAGYAMLTYTIKQSTSGSGFLPVGEKLFVGKKIFDEQMIIYLTDEDGYAKAQSKPMKLNEAEKIMDKIISDGIDVYPDPVKTI